MLVPSTFDTLFQFSNADMLANQITEKNKLIKVIINNNNNKPRVKVGVLH